MTRALVGRCECGATEYRVADEFLYSLNCHCSNCRAHTGSAFKPFAGIEGTKLEIVKGADNLLVWGDADPEKQPKPALRRARHARARLAKARRQQACEARTPRRKAQRSGAGRGTEELR